MALQTYNDWLQQYKNPDYWKYDSMQAPSTFNIDGADQSNVDPWAAYREGVPKYTKGLVDYIKYAMPDLENDPAYKGMLINQSPFGNSPAGNQISERLYGSPFLENNIQHPLYLGQNTPREVLEAVYPSTAAFLRDDPIISSLKLKGLIANSKGRGSGYKLTREP